MKTKELLAHVACASILNSRNKRKINKKLCNIYNVESLFDADYSVLKDSEKEEVDFLEEVYKNIENEGRSLSEAKVILDPYF